MLTRRKALTLGAGLLLPSITYGAAKDITTKITKWYVGSHAFVVRARREKYSTKIVSAKEITGNDFASTQEIQEKTGAYAVFNGSNFERDGSPSGLYVHRGNIVHQFVREKGDGFIYTDRDGQVKIIGSSGLSSFIPVMVEAIQVNLVSAGKVIFYRPYRGDIRLPRTFVGLSDNGLVAAVFKNVTFALGDKLMRDYGCHIVAALGEGNSSSACDKFGIKSFRKGDSLEERVPNFLVIYD